MKFRLLERSDTERTMRNLNNSVGIFLTKFRCADTYIKFYLCMSFNGLEYVYTKEKRLTASYH